MYLPIGKLKAFNLQSPKSFFSSKPRTAQPYSCIATNHDKYFLQHIIQVLLIIGLLEYVLELRSIIKASEPAKSP